ncbi:MAG: hypothetical protein HZB64_01180 [Rhodocyclales bacterium]|nr:hypothetical protein [Rhodocyclales bacterium]
MDRQPKEKVNGLLPCDHRSHWRPSVTRNGNFIAFNPKEGKTIMKTLILVATIVASTLSAPIVSAQDNKHAHDKPAMSVDKDKHMSQMQEKMKAMQTQMDTIRNTADPQERQKLMREHMQAMQENMKAMHAMGGAMMMGAQKGGGMMDGMKDCDMMKHHAMMENRMDMMQMMMEQMMQRDQMMQSMPSK